MPAHGLLATQVDGIEVANLQDVFMLLRGEAGTSVTLTVEVVLCARIRTRRCCITLVTRMPFSS